MNKKKSFTHFISPMSWFFSLGAFAFAILLIFRPNLSEFFWTFIIVDNIALGILGLLFFPIFYHYVPQAKMFFFGIDHEVFAKLNESERINLLVAMMKFPKQYALALYFGSFLKGIPVYLMFIFFWQREGSSLMPFMIFFIFTGVCYLYFYGCGLFDAHTKINVWIEDLHSKFNLTTEFERLELPNKPENLHFQEILVQIFIIVFVLTLQSVIIISKQYNSEGELVFKITTIGIIGLALFTRIWYLGRIELLGGLTKIVKHMNSVDLNQNALSLPLHSSALLATFEKAFNLLESRIGSSERKLRGLVFQESEKSRYQALGEMSALIAHDLSAPLHAIQYCHTEIKEQKLAEAADPYVQQMGLNISQSIELISALRARLKNDTSTVQKSNYLESHELVIRLLETQFSSRLFQRLTITLDPNIADLTIAISRVDLMQIIDNLYRNSIKNLISTVNEKPTLEIHLKEKSDDFASIIISDNGTGLSYEEFNLMTDDKPIAESSVSTARSLGLRLTRRLVENYGGTLTLIQPDTTEPNPVGTKFLLRLKLYNTDTISI